MSKKKIISLCLCTLLVAFCVSAEAQQSKKVPLIGYLSSGESAPEAARAEPIRLALRERGHIEGQNIAMEYRYGEGKIDRASKLADELGASRLTSSW
jgi:putative tryptophan/tyrosine transport system substrate-binding protein